jgi:hypothetical protein
MQAWYGSSIRVGESEEAVAGLMGVAVIAIPRARIV